MYKIAVLGERDSVVAFSALGLTVFPVESGQEAEQTFRKVVKSDEYAIIYVTETYYSVLEDDIDKIKDRAVPAVILIPGRDGSLGLGRTALDKAVERAIGSQIV